MAHIPTSRFTATIVAILLALTISKTGYAQHFERVPFIYTINFFDEIRGVDDTSAYAIVQHPGDSLYRWSASDGQWHVFTPAIPSGIIPRQVAVSVTGTLFVRTGQGLFRIPKSGASSVVIPDSVLNVQTLPNGDVAVQYYPTAWLRSLDDGLTWDTIRFSPIVEWDRGGNWYQCTGSRTYRRGRMDSDWTEYVTPDNLIPHAFASPSSNCLIFSDGSRIRRTLNGGQTWDSVFEAASIRDLCCDSLGNAYACGQHALYRSTDSGATWQAYDTIHDLEKLSAIGQHTLMGMGYRQSWRISLPDFTWTECDSPHAQNLQVDLLESKNDTIVAGAEGYGIERRDDPGASWKQIGPPNAPGGLGVGFAFSPTGGAWFGANDKLWYSPDWTHWTDFAQSTRSSLHVDSSGIVFADNERSTDFGRSWQYIPEQVNAINPKGTVYAVGNIWFLASFDHADTWAIKTTLPKAIGTFHFVDYCGGAVWVGGSNGLYRSTNDGRTWTDASTGLPSHFGHPLRTPHGAIVIMGSDSTLPSLNIYQYDAQNSTWNRRLSDTTLKVPLVACFDKTYLYVGDQFQGLWRIRIPDLQLGVPMASEASAANTVLPNPNNGTFRIKDASAKDVRLTDLLGREQRLSHITSSGETEVETVAPSGSYILHFTADGQPQTVLVRIAR